MERNDRLLVEETMRLLLAQGHEPAAAVLRAVREVRRPDPGRRWSGRWVLAVDEQSVAEVGYDLREQLKRALNGVAGTDAAAVDLVPHGDRSRC